MKKITLLLTILLISATGLFAQTAVFTTQPADQTVYDGEVATFTVVAEAFADGTPWTQFQWIQSNDGGANWLQVNGQTTNTMTVNATMALNGQLFAAVATSGSGFDLLYHELSESATLTVNEAPTVVFTTQPMDETVYDGEVATFTVVAEAFADGTPWTQFQWIQSNDGGANWLQVNGQTTNTMTVNATMALNGQLFAAVATSGSGFDLLYHELSESATLTVNEAPTVVFTTQPMDETVYDGEVATFTVVAEAFADGTPWTQFQWIQSNDGGANWLQVNGQTTNTMTVNATMALNGQLFAAVATSGSGFDLLYHELSESATLTVNEAPTVVFTAQPMDATVYDGEVATFTVVAEAFADGTPWTQFQWIQSNDGGANWLQVNGQTTNTMTVNATMALNGQLFAAVATSGSGFDLLYHELSESATLTVNEAPTVVFTTQPMDETVYDGEVATFTVVAEAFADGTPWTQFQWIQSNDGGANWLQVNGQTTNTMTVNATMALNGQLFAAVATSGSGFDLLYHELSESATLTVNEAPTVVFTTQPMDETVYDGEVATFTVVAEAFADGTPWTQFQWIQSNDGGANWLQVNGQTTNTMTVNATMALNGQLFAAVATSGSGFDLLYHELSESATLTVNEAPTVVFTAQPMDATVYDGEVATFTVVAEAFADGTPWTQFQWIQSNDGGANWLQVNGQTTNTMTVNATMALNGQLFAAVATSGSGFDLLYHELSESATLTVNEAPTVVFTTQPMDETVYDGEVATFTVVAEAFADGTPWTQFQWIQSNDGGANWLQVNGQTTNTMTVNATMALNGQLFAAVATSGSGFDLLYHELSESATLTVNEAPTVVFTAQPMDATVYDGEVATFTVVAEAFADGTPWTQFQWIQSNDGGANWLQVNGQTTNTMTVNATMALNGQLFAAVATSGSGFDLLYHELSESATLTVNEAPTVVFTTQPMDATVYDGEVATFTVVAEAFADGTPWTQFQWIQSNDGGANWLQVNGQTTNTMTVNATMALNGQLFAAVATSGSGFDLLYHELSESATLTVLELVTYTITFHVMDANGNLAGANIAIDGNDLTTDVDGNSMIELIDGDYAYSIVAEGYDDVFGNVTIAGASITEEVVMTETIVYYMVTFHVSDANGDLENALISIAGTDIYSDIDGIATIELADGDYDYTVFADGYIEYSGTITVSGDVVTETIVIIIDGINELNAANISIYPNPSNGVVFINVDNEFTLSVIDISGKIVYSTEINANTKIDLTDQNPGLYIFRLINNKDILTYRVIVE